MEQKVNIKNSNNLSPNYRHFKADLIYCYQYNFTAQEVNSLTLTTHAKQRMTERIITLQDVYNCVKLGTSTPAKNNLTKYTYNDLYVIIDTKNNIIITTCFTNTYTSKIKKYAKNNYIGFYVAIRKLRSCLDAV